MLCTHITLLREIGLGTQYGRQMPDRSAEPRTTVTVYATLDVETVPGTQAATIFRGREGQGNS